MVFGLGGSECTRRAIGVRKVRAGRKKTQAMTGSTPPGMSVNGVSSSTGPQRRQQLWRPRWATLALDSAGPTYGRWGLASGACLGGTFDAHRLRFERRPSDAPSPRVRRLPRLAMKEAHREAPREALCGHRAARERGRPWRPRSSVYDRMPDAPMRPHLRVCIDVTGLAKFVDNPSECTPGVEVASLANPAPGWAPVRGGGYNTNVDVNGNTLTWMDLLR